MRRLGVLRKAFPRIKYVWETHTVCPTSAALNLQGIGFRNEVGCTGILEVPCRGLSRCFVASAAFSKHIVTLRRETKSHELTPFMCPQRSALALCNVRQLLFWPRQTIFSWKWCQGTQNSEPLHRRGEQESSIGAQQKGQGLVLQAFDCKHVKQILMDMIRDCSSLTSTHAEMANPRTLNSLSFGQRFPLEISPLQSFGRYDDRNGCSGLISVFHSRSFSSDAGQNSPDQPSAPELHDQSQRAVMTALWCNFLVFALKCGVWMVTASHVMLAEAVHSLADVANQLLLAYGLFSSRRAPDALHPYGYSKESFVWSLISAVGIFCLGSGATIVHGISNLWGSELPENIFIAALVIGGSMIMEGASLLVAMSAVRKGAAAEGMTLHDYVWRGHDPTAVAVMMEDGAAVTGLIIAMTSLVAVTITGNPIYDPIGSILVGNLLGMVAIFLIQRNRHALLGRAMDDQDMKRVLDFLSSDPVVDAIYDCKSEVIGPGSYRFKAEIDFNGVEIVQNYLQRTGREAWTREFTNAVKDSTDASLDRVMALYGEEVVTALGSEVDRLEKEIQSIVPGIRHVDIETHNPNGPLPG